MDHGDNAFMLMCSALVLMMTLPGLLYFNSGIRPAHRMELAIQTLGLAGLAGLWFITVDYPSIFSVPTALVDIDTVNALAPTIPAATFILFQLGFYVITPCLVLPTLAGRGLSNFATIVMMSVWSWWVYDQVAMQVWGPDGMLHALNVLDYAGGLVVHSPAGVASLVFSFILPRVQNEKPEEYDLAVGTALLVVGWLAFNGGSAGAADARASMAALNSVVAVSGATFLAWFVGHAESVEEFSVAIVSALVAITPACGFVDVPSALFIGTFGYIVAWTTRIYVAPIVGDPAGVFSVHGTPGFAGTILTGVFATNRIVGGAPLGVVDGEFHQLTVQWCSTALVVFYTLAVTTVLAIIARVVIAAGNAMTPSKAS